MSVFAPREYVKRYQDFPAERLYQAGYNTFFVDIDNTLAIPNVELTPKKEVVDFVNGLKAMGYRVIVYSNNKKERVVPYAEGLNCEYVYFAMKPLPFRFLKALKRFGVDRKHSVIMGDQLLTDCLLGNILKVYVIYCSQLMEKDSWTTVLNRKIERFIFKYVLHEKV